MKSFINLILLVIISTNLIGCSQDDDSSNNSIPSELLGKWNLIERYSSYFEEFVSYQPGDYTYEFKSDGRYEERINFQLGLGTGTGGPFSVSGNQLTLGSVESYFETYIITELTVNNLKLSDEDGQLMYIMEKEN